MGHRGGLPLPLVVAHVDKLVIVREAGVGAEEVRSSQHVGQIAQILVAPVVQLGQARPRAPLDVRIQTLEVRNLQGISKLSKKLWGIMYASDLATGRFVAGRQAHPTQQAKSLPQQSSPGASHPTMFSSMLLALQCMLSNQLAGLRCDEIHKNIQTKAEPQGSESLYGRSKKGRQLGVQVERRGAQCTQR